MRLILLGLVFYLLVAAYFAAVRVARKRQLAKFSQNSSGQTLPPSARQTRLDRANIPQSAKEAIGSALEAVGLSDQPQTLDQTTEPAQEISEPATATAPELAGVETPIAPLSAPEIPQSIEETANDTAPEPSSPALPIGSPVVFAADTDLTLAVSLSVTDIVHPESAGTVEVPDLIPTDPAISEVLNAKAEPAPAHHSSILEEIAELRPMADAQADPASHILHVLHTGDGTMRVAAVYELGELAAQRHGNEAQELIQQLQQLTQDEDPDVRLQAIAALAKVQR